MINMKLEYWSGEGRRRGQGQGRSKPAAGYILMGTDIWRVVGLPKEPRQPLSGSMMIWSILKHERKPAQSSGLGPEQSGPRPVAIYGRKRLKVAKIA